MHLYADISTSPLRRFLRSIEDAGGEGAGGGGGSGGAIGTFTVPVAGDGGATDPLVALEAEQNRIAGRARAEGKKAAEKATAEALGCTIEEAKAIIAAKRTADDATKSEAERLRDEAASAKTAADADRAAAAADRRAATIERALIAANLLDKVPAADQPERLTRAARMIDPDLDVTDPAAVAADAAKVVGLLAPPAAGTGPTVPPYVPPTPGTPPAGGNPTPNALEQGAALAKQRHPVPANAA